MQHFQLTSLASPCSLRSHANAIWWLAHDAHADRLPAQPIFSGRRQPRSLFKWHDDLETPMLIADGLPSLTSLAIDESGACVWTEDRTGVLRISPDGESEGIDITERADGGLYTWKGQLFLKGRVEGGDFGVYALDSQGSQWTLVCKAEVSTLGSLRRVVLHAGRVYYAWWDGKSCELNSVDVNDGQTNHLGVDLAFTSHRKLVSTPNGLLVYGDAGLFQYTPDRGLECLVEAQHVRPDVAAQIGDELFWVTSALQTASGELRHPYQVWRRALPAGPPSVIYESPNPLVELVAYKNDGVAFVEREARGKSIINQLVNDESVESKIHVFVP